MQFLERQIYFNTLELRTRDRDHSKPIVMAAASIHFHGDIHAVTPNTSTVSFKTS